MTITEFLLARIAEDEHEAQLAIAEGYTALEPLRFVYGYDNVPDLTIDPARVLTECEAKRRIVEATRFADNPGSAVDFWLGEARGLTPPREVGVMIGTLRALASVYADHPDYDQEWRP